MFHLPEPLCSLYTVSLSALGLMGAASSETKHEVYGGPTIEETNDHFAYRFPNSVVRLECVLLDPHEQLGEISKDLLLTLSSHHVSILDVPCGAGAAGLTLLNVMRELRATKCVPMQPLTVTMLGADISVAALQIYETLFARLAPSLAEYGISTSLRTRHWDARSIPSTVDLCDDWLVDSSRPNEFIALLTNLSGAGKKHLTEIMPSIEHISTRLSNRPSTIVWIEPGGRGGVNMLGRIYNALRRYVWLQSSSADGTSPTSSFRWWHAIQQRALPGSAAVHRFFRS